MFSNVLSAAICGMESCPIYVEADVSNGLPEFTMVGYLTSQVKEAQERVRTALRNSGVRMEPKKITVNLSPGDLRKDGTGFDLPIAVAVLAAYGQIPEDRLHRIMVMGELSLNGEVKGIRGILPMVHRAREQGCLACILPRENEQEGRAVGGIRVIGISSLRELIDCLNGNRDFPEESRRVSLEELYQRQEEQREDFRELSGQEGARRAAEIAAAGMHNLLLIGPPGSGKSMIARRMAGILPELTREESLEISGIYSVAGLLDEETPLFVHRPFRAPHHTISPQALAGGGRIPKPGEISLAHKGVLFLDELPEYSRGAIEILRQPLEERQVRISRTHGTYSFPADFMLIAAMNPCKCGYYPDLDRCTCTQSEIHQYLGKISRPLLDRIDICTEVPQIRYEDLKGFGKNESTAQMKERVIRAQSLQKKRYQGTGFRFNSQLNVQGIRRFCPMGSQEETFLEAVFQKLKLSVRAYHRMIKVARTIADLDASEKIRSEHLAEAVCYRCVDQKFWG